MWKFYKWHKKLSSGTEHMPGLPAKSGLLRCVIPSTGFYEWDREKRKYFFTVPNEEALYMAGLYAIRESRPCFCILTTAASHNRKLCIPTKIINGTSLAACAV